MNLATLAQRACLEAGYNDSDDLSAAKQFARHWDEHIWNHALWKDALITATVAIDPENDEDHAEGVIWLPESIDRVVAVRTTGAAVNVHAQEHYYRMDFDMFALNGEATQFFILPPAWFKWRTNASVLSIAASGAVADASTGLRIVWLDGAGKLTVTDTTVGAELALTPADGESITILAVYKAVTPAEVQLLDSLRVTGAGTAQANGIYSLSNAGEYTSATHYMVLSGSGAQLFDGDTDALLYSGDPYIGLWTTVNNGQSPAPTVAQNTMSLAAADTRSPSYQRIRILPIPESEITLMVLGKQKYLPLDNDYQEPALRNCTNALLAFIRGSLKRRGEQNGSAQLEFAEANALLTKLAGLEAHQAANNVRFTPEAGYGPEYGLGPL